MEYSLCCRYINDKRDMIQPWMRGFLLLGAAYNFMWALFLYLKPGSYIVWLSEGALRNASPITWLTYGVFLVGVFMLLGTIKPYRFKWLIALAVLAKLSGGLWVYYQVLNQLFTKKFLFHLIMNDLVWVIPLLIISLRVFKGNKDHS
jgi:hypothetical protein